MNLFMGTAAAQINKQDRSTTCHAPTEHPAWFGPLGIGGGIWWNTVEYGGIMWNITQV